MTQRSWMWLVLVILQLSFSLMNFFEYPHDMILRATIVALWIATVWASAPVLMVGFRHGLSGMRDALNRRTALRPTANDNSNRVMLTMLVVGMAVVTGYCVWLAYKG